ncbi:hypothetical protein [Segetibacter aerophilus]|uniref:Uncharacterized protein n=1 Tax=Segetibacter aerophilus TaxID=670293 RepID=A0A512BEB0_9BACT|nr:hypothetical protein [Segetibacter aerophilus]GEO10306.1 hypothetical protein SAE01_28020 [Segetibacter aerophilus]
MSNSKDHSGSKGNDGTTTKNKGESQQSHQKGAKSVSKHDTGKHTKDESGGAAHNTTKKQENSI